MRCAKCYCDLGYWPGVRTWLSGHRLLVGRFMNRAYVASF